MIPSHEFSVVLDVVGFFTHSIVVVYYTKNEEPSTPWDDFFHFFFWKMEKRRFLSLLVVFLGFGRFFLGGTSGFRPLLGGFGQFCGIFNPSLSFTQSVDRLG